MKKIYIQNSIAFIALWCFYLVAWAQIPQGYYDSSAGKNERELKTALFHIISQGMELPRYGSGTGSTWAAFNKTDKRSDGSVWDMYSNEKRYFSVNNQSTPGMNIEHSLPKSWWGWTSEDAAYRDILQLRPSDAEANTAKNNYIMAVVDRDITFDNGCTKVGYTTYCPGKITPAWEPADEYKGDFARMYMYMVTCYEDYAERWRSRGTDQLQNNTYPVFQDWTIKLLLQWSEQDPVSEKEEILNNEAFKIQKNRNPFIDYPMLAEYIWGDYRDRAFDPEAINASRTISPVFSQTEGYYSSPFAVTLTCATNNADIYYTLDGTTPTTNSLKYATPIQITAKETIVKAVAIAESLESSRVATAIYHIGEDPSIAKSISELRTFNPDKSTIYTLRLQDAVVTYVDGRYLFLQDNLAGICIFGYEEKPALAIGDLVSGEIVGKLSSFSSLLEIVNPTYNLSVSSSLGVIQPDVITVNELQNNFAKYDSRLIQLKKVSFEATTFTSNSVGIHDDGFISMTCRNQFNAVSISSLPTEGVDLVGIAMPYTYNSVLNKQIALRGDFDIITIPVSIDRNESSSLNIKVQDRKLVLSTKVSTPVQISDILGRTVRDFIFEAGEKEILLPSGIYIVNGKKVIL